MNAWLLGGLLGLVLAAGVVLALRAAPPLRPIRLADRMAPYLADAPRPSRLLARPSATAAPFVVARRLFGPMIADAVGVLDRTVGGGPSVRRRLTGLRSGLSPEDFRIEQVVWGALGMLGLGLLVGLAGVAEETTLEPFARFVQGVVVGIERGTPLADVLRAQAVDVREIGKRALLDAGGRKEISMMVPVVFLILPVTVLFALYPGLLTLTSLAR